MIAINIYHTEL